MKLFYFFAAVLFSQLSFSQNWKDSLSSARKLYKEQKFQESYKKYKSAKKIAPKTIDFSEEMAQSAYKSNEFKEAENLYSKTKTNKNVDKAKIQHNLGNSHLKQKNYQKAVEAYKESLRNNPNDEETRYNLAEAMKKRKENQKKDNKQNDQDQKNRPENKPQESNKNENSNKEKSPKENKTDKENKSSQEKSEENQQSQLNGKKTDRMLDDLAKKEMETKKKIGGQKSKNNTSRRTKTGKDW